MLREKGLIKYCVLPSQRLYHPVLQFCCNDNERKSDVECDHETVSKSALLGTWVIDEVRLGVQKSYEVIEIFEVYEYAVRHDDTHTDQGVLFVENVVTF